VSTGGPAFPVPDLHHANGQVQRGSDGMTLLDWFAGQALAGLIGLAARHDCVMDDIAKDTYNQASAMLAEKARREAVVKESSTPDHSGEANKMVPDHSPDAGKMVELEAQNQELEEALELLVCESEKVLKKGYFFAELSRCVVTARAALAKHKEDKP